MGEPAVRHLFLTSDYPPDSGGMARRHVELCRRMPPGSIEVSTVAHPDAPAFDRGEPYPIHRQQFTFGGARRTINRMRWARWLARRTGRSARGGKRPDVVHCGNIRPTGFVAWWALARTGVPYLVYVNGGDLLIERRKARHRLKRVAARFIFRRAAGIVANSAWTADLSRDTMRMLGVQPMPPIAHIDLGTDPAHFRPDRDTGALRRELALSGALVMLTVARLVPHKGQDIGIRALALLRAEFPTLHYLIVGAGPDLVRLRDLAAALGVAERVTFAGQLTDDAIAEAYATADVYLGASRAEGDVSIEGFGIAFVEAAASGTPVVAGRSGGVASAVRDGETGLLVDPEDVHAVSEALARLLRDRSLRETMGRAGRHAVETHFNWDRVARETLAFADTVVPGRTTR